MANIFEKALMRLAGRREEDADEEDKKKKEDKAPSEDKVDPSIGQAINSIKKRRKAIDDI